MTDRARKCRPDGSALCDQSATAKFMAKLSNRKYISTLVTFWMSVLVVTMCSAFGKGQQPLARSYALCSRDSPNIYTVDDLNSRAQCILVHDTKIAFVGSLTEILKNWQDKSYRPVVLNAIEDEERLQIKFIPRGAIIVPGLSDSHGHILEYGASRMLSLEGAEDVSGKKCIFLAISTAGNGIVAVVRRVENYVVSHSDISNDMSRFIGGWGWDHTRWPHAQFPTYEDLEKDDRIKNRHIILQSKDGHALWVSSAVLQRMLPLPNEIDGGIILRDGNGNPTGVFIDKAQELVPKPIVTEEDLLLRFQFAVNDALANGLTSVHDAGFDPTSLSFFKRQAELGPLPLRIYGMTYFDESARYWGNKESKVIGAGEGTLTARSVKIFADGALRSGGAALHEPYSDHPETKGVMRLNPETLHDVIPKFLRDGWQVNVHAIGDRANGIVLDAFESALKRVNVTALRPRLEHAQMMTDADMKRLGKLGVIASVQPVHAISDMWYAEDRLGADRVRSLYAFRSIMENDVRITMGSDFPVENMNPLSGFYAAITRLSHDGHSPHGSKGWFPEQRLTRREALRGMTIDPAYASFTESDLGSLIPGKRADYVVLSQNIMSVPAERILKTKVLATVIDGCLKYGQI